MGSHKGGGDPGSSIQTAKCRDYFGTISMEETKCDDVCQNLKCTDGLT